MFDYQFLSMDKIPNIILTAWALLIVSMVHAQHMSLRHNGTAVDDNHAYITSGSDFYIECETQVLDHEVFVMGFPAAPTCAQCYPNGNTFVHPSCRAFVNFECITNVSILGQLEVNAPPRGLYRCTYMSSLNETHLLQRIAPDNITINGLAYTVKDEKSNFTCSTSLAAPRPTFEWFTTDSDGTDTEIHGDTEDDDDEDRNYNKISFVVPSGKEIIVIWCVAKQTSFDMNIASEKLEADILVRATPPEWENDTGRIYYEPDEPIHLVVSSNDARPKANATWFYLNGADDHIINGSQSSWNESDKIWHDVVFRPSAYHDGVDVYCSVDQGPPLYAQKSSLRRLTRSDITTQGPETTTDSSINQETTNSTVTIQDTTTDSNINQGFSSGEIIGIVLGSVFGAAILLIILVYLFRPEALASCGSLSCCVKSATLKNTAETIPIQ